MSALSHPNIAAVHDWGEERVGKRTTVFAVVEHLSGGSLRDLFDRGRYLDPSQALVVGLEACRGLDFAHRKGLVHTELTPAKLVFGDDRRLRIVDFGLARMLGAHDWSEPATVATHVARYSSPEQALGQPIDGKTDVYSLALILVEAVTRTVPFAARSTVATLSARIGRLMPVSADLGPLASVLEKAGRPEPADRSTAAELGRSLVRTAEKLPRPKPIPLLITGLFEDDPSRLRRPNDPTGGITRPAPADEPVPLVPPVPAPEEPAAEPAADVAAGAATTPEEAAAVAAVAAVATDRAPAAAPAADAPSTSPQPLPPPVVEVVEEGSPRLYDGDADRTVDELAALAKATAAPEVPAPEAPAVDPSPGDPGWSASLETMDDGRSRRRWPAWLAGILVVVALAGLGYLAYRLFLVPTHEVPELVGLDEEAAEAQTAGFDWELDVETARSDEQPEPGAIIRTAPAAGERLAEGEPFLIVVSEGPEFRELPDFAGQPLNEAETTLAELRLVALPPTQQFDETVPVGSVVSWSVPAEPSLVAGDEVLPEAEVALVVSSGPAPRAIPALVGVPVADATAQLEAMQLVAAIAEPVFSDDIPAGNVVSITPAAATEVPARTRR